MQSRGDERRGSHTCYGTQWAVLGVSALLKGTSAMPRMWTSTLQLPVPAFSFWSGWDLSWRPSSPQASLLIREVAGLSHSWFTDRDHSAVFVPLVEHLKYFFLPFYGFIDSKAEEGDRKQREGEWHAAKGVKHRSAAEPQHKGCLLYQLS